MNEDDNFSGEVVIKRLRSIMATFVDLEEDFTNVCKTGYILTYTVW